jgi:hypothetical protein
MNKKLAHLIGKKVIATLGGVQVVCKLLSLESGFKGRDVVIELPVTKQKRRIYASKVEEIRP